MQQIFCDCCACAGSCFCCDTVLDPSSVTADELKHLNQSILHHLLKRKVRVASTSKLVFILSFFGPCQLFKINYKGPELFARGVREYLCGGHFFCPAPLATLCPPSVPLFWQKYWYFFNYVSYSIIYSIHTSI